MNGPVWRDEFSCSARAISSLPVPDSPVMRTVDGVSATFSTTTKIWWIAADCPISPNRPRPAGTSGVASRRASA